MADSLQQLLARLQGAQRDANRQQVQVAQAVDQTLSSGLASIADVAASLDGLRSRHSDTPTESVVAPPSQNSPGDTSVLGVTENSPGDDFLPSGALVDALANLARAQIDSQNRNAHVANAVSSAVASGLTGVGEVAEGLRRLADPAVPDLPLSYRQQQAYDASEFALAALHRAPDAVAPPSTLQICPACQGSGRISVPN